MHADYTTYILPISWRTQYRMYQWTFRFELQQHTHHWRSYMQILWIARADTMMPRRQKSVLQLNTGQMKRDAHTRRMIGIWTNPSALTMLSTPFGYMPESREQQRVSTLPLMVMCHTANAHSICHLCHLAVVKCTDNTAKCLEDSLVFCSFRVFCCSCFDALCS